MARPNHFVRQLLVACLLSGIAVLTGAVRADGVVTMSGMSVEGKISSEDDNQVVLETEYGQLRFLKIKLKSIVRGGAPPANVDASGGTAPAPEPEPAANPFGGAPATSNPFDAPPAASDPFGGAPATSDPFGGPADGGTAAPAASSDPASAFGGFGSLVASAPAPAPGFNDPFGGGGGDPSGGGSFGGNPFGGGASNNPFGGGAPPVPATPSPTPSPTPKVRFLTPARDLAPSVAQGSDGLLFGVGAEGPGFFRAGSAGDWSTAREDVPLKVGAEVQSRETATVRFVLRGGLDEFRLGPDSQVSLRSLDADGQAPALALPRGALWIKAGSRTGDQKLTISTTEFVATTSGGTFMVDRFSGASRVTVGEGEVFVKSNGTEVYVTLRAGQSATVNVVGQILGVRPSPVDVVSSWDNWDQTSFDTLLPMASLQEEMVQANKAWEAEMGGYSRSLAELQYQEKLNAYAESFLKLAGDTGTIPTSATGWSAARFDTGLPGWSGPYLDGPIPPLDPWKQPLVYKALKSQSGNDFGRVYSIWQDGRDQGGENASVDKVALVMYFSLERFRKAAGN